MHRRSPPWIHRALVGALLAMLILPPAPAPATVSEQRARLPPAAECDDPIEGTWRGLSYYPLHRQWYEFTLEIRRREGKGSELSGSIDAHFWDGEPGSSEPGACQGGQRVIIQQTAAGTFAGGKVHFGGTSWKLGRVLCGQRTSGDYVLDQFKGTLEPERHEFQSINDWTEREEDEATVFRRIRCAEPSAPDDRALAPAGVEPPPFYPRAREGGC